MTAIFWGNLQGVDDQATAIQTVGLEPIVVTLQVSGAQLTEGPIPEVPLNPFEGYDGESSVLPPLQLGAVLDGEGTERPDAVVRPPFVGDVILAQEGEDGQLEQVHFKNMFFTEYRVVGGVGAGFDPPTYEYVLESVARYWDAYGEVTAKWNVRLRGRRYLSDTAVRYDRSTLREDASGRRPHTLREICQDLADRLPGKPQIRRWPLNAEPELPIEVRAWAARPKPALKKILDTLRLVPVHERDGSLSVYKVGEGTVGERSDQRGGNNQLQHFPESGNGAWEGLVDSTRNFYARRADAGNPSQVLVVGGKTVFTVRIDYWIPVLVLDVVDQQTGEPTRLVLDVTRQNLIDALSLPEDVADDLVFNLPLTTAAEQKLLATVPAQSASLLRRQLGRFYRCPTRAKHYLPILPRAERYASGARMPPLCEAFSYTAAKVDIRHELLDLLVPDDRRTPDEIQFQALGERVAELENRLKALDWITLEGLQAALGALGGEIQLILDLRTAAVDLGSGKVFDDQGFLDAADPSAFAPEQIEESLKAFARKAVLGATGPLAFKIDDMVGDLQGYFQESVLVAKLTAEGNGFGVSFERVPGASYDAARPTYKQALVPGRFENPILQVALPNASPQQIINGWGDLATLGQSMERLGVQVAGEFFGIDLIDTSEAAIAAVRQELDQTKKARADLLKKIDPKRALQEQITQLEAQLNAAREQTGVENKALLEQIQDLREQLTGLAVFGVGSEILSGPGADKIPEELKKPYIVTQLVNQRRRPTDVRIVDADQGLIEVRGPLPCWLASQQVDKASDTFAILMPVALTFGSHNSAPVEELSEEAQADLFEGTYLEAGVTAARDLDLDQFVYDLGDLVPGTPGEHQIRFGFDPRDPDEGVQDLDPAEAYLIQAPELQLLMPLGDIVGNVSDLREVAQEVAQGAMFTPNGALDGGSIAVHGAHRVNPNGRISGVRWNMNLKGCGFTTEVSFDAPEAPLTGVVRPLPEGGFYSFTFGQAE